ncbi:Ttc26 [Symbiodinium necroappetens]|uniref:Ttc26 protein n=1 Tax=Symbiodinium necroappetens TaxID=1628268 RepID=A0A812WFB3_9DINO|nr:Ttc26 [Symbiodinium necroappetens]
MWSFVAWFMLGRVRSQSAQNSPDTSCTLQFSAARHIEASEPHCLSSADWMEQLRVTALNFSGGNSVFADVFTDLNLSTGAEDDVILMTWSPSAGPAPGDVLVFNNNTSTDSPGWQLQANLTEIASQNVTLPFDWAKKAALSSEKIVVALSLVNDTSTTHTFKYEWTPPVVQLSVYQWAGNSWSNVANISPPASFPVIGLGLDVDGDYIISGWIDEVDSVTVIYQNQGGQWEEVFRISNNLVQSPTIFGISSSGKAVVNCAGALLCAGVTIFEASNPATILNP